MAGSACRTRILFVTGRLAARPLEAVISALAGGDSGISASALCLPISVAALMTPEWALRQIIRMRREDCPALSERPDRIVMPGRVAGSLRDMEEALGAPVTRGPDDLWDIPEWLGIGACDTGEAGGGDGSFRIIAEITEAWRMTPDAIVSAALCFRESGADVIDLGGNPETGVPEVAEKLAALKGLGFLVSVDTFHRETILRAVSSGADMILSVNSSNMDLLGHAAKRCRFVVVPDYEGDESGYIASLEVNAREAARMGADVIADPILCPPMLGFVQSLCRYYEYRSLHPDAPMMMGAGNVTELLEADSAGVNALLASCVQELGIEYVLTTEVARWARGTVRELLAARMIMKAAGERRMPPKKISQALRELKGPPPRYREEQLREMQSGITDLNWRIFVTEDAICAFNRDRFLCGRDITAIYAGMNLTDPGHSFYAGRELQKAAIALRLGRNYVQDDDLLWGVMP